MIKVTRKDDENSNSVISKYIKRAGKTKANIVRRSKASRYFSKTSDLVQKRKALRRAAWQKVAEIKKRLAKF